MTTHYQKIQALGNRMVTNLNAKGVSASFNDGGLTLADKILEINQFDDGVFITGDKITGQTGDTIHFTAMKIADKMFKVGETIIIEDSVNTTPIYTKTRTGETPMTGSNIGSYSWMLVFGTYTGDEDAPYVYVGDENATEKKITKTSTGFNIKDDSTLNVNLTGTMLYFYNTVFWTDTGEYYDMLTYHPDFTPTGYYMSTIIFVEGTISFYKIHGGGITGANGIVTGSYSCSGAGKRTLAAKCSSLQETYELMDCLFYLECTSETNNWSYNDARVSASFDENGGHFTGLESTSFKQVSLTNNGARFLDGTKDCIIEYDIKKAYTVRLSIVDNGATLRQVIWFGGSYTSNEWHHIKLVYNASTHKITPYVDNTALTDVDVSSYTMTTFGIGFMDDSSNQMDFYLKNIKIYPI